MSQPQPEKSEQPEAPVIPEANSKKNKEKLNISFDSKLTLEHIYQAHLRARKGKTKKRDVIDVDLHPTEYLTHILEVLQAGNYKPSEFHQFTVTDPKKRLVLALPYVDRIVHQWLIEEFIKPYYLPRFIKDSYACIPGRGSHAAVKCIQVYMRDMRQRQGKYYIVKMDISKYFYNIDRDVLFKILKRAIASPRLLDLLHTIIFSDEARVGIPIGNYTSQYFANIYLNELDQYCKHNLGVKYCVRYMDDFIILAPNKRQAKQWYEAIQRYVESYLHLKLNPKSCFYFSSHGLDFVGYKMTHSCLRLRQRSKRKLNNIIWDYQHDYTTETDFVTSIAAWLGHAGHANAKTYIRKRLWSYRDMLLKHWKSAGPRAFFTKKAKSDGKVKTVGGPTARPSAAV